MTFDGTQVIPITEKVKNYLHSSEGKDYLKSTVLEFITSTIQSEVRNMLSSYDGKKLIQSAIPDSRNMVSGGSYVDSGLESRLEGRLDNKFDSKIESKFNSFCMNSNFKNHVLSIVQTQSYFEELCKQIFMENAIRHTIEKIAPDSVKKEIKRQVNEIIREKFDDILVKELNKTVPQMIQTQCQQMVPRIATDTARTEAQSTVESMTPSLVSKEMHTQFPAYIQNHPAVQAIMIKHTTELTEQLRNTSEVELNRITGDDHHNVLVKKHLEETDHRCQAEVANFKSNMDIQLQQNAFAFHSQMTGFGQSFTNQMNSNIEATNQQLHHNHQAVQTQIAQSANTVAQITQDMGVVNGNITKLSNKIDNLEKANTALQRENDTIKSFIRYGAVAIIGIIAWVGYSWFNRGGSVMPKIVYT